MKRREFLRQTAARPRPSAASRRISPPSARDATRPDRARAYGQTGEKLSIVAFGGYVLNRSTTEQAEAWVRLAYDAGVNHFDVARARHCRSADGTGPGALPEEDLPLLQDRPAHR